MPPSRGERETLMSSDSSEPGDHLRTRWPEALVAGFLLALSLLVITDSLRVGTGWADDGPRSGYFPFYVGLMLAGSSAWVLLSTLWTWRSDKTVFAEHEQIKLVAAMLVPMAVYTGLIFLIGIYIASALLISYFMLRYGKYKLAITLPVAIGVPLVFFAVFERWFLVPLPKGPLERMLGF
jgi:putative tricarboxylic transport membrane protein